MDMIAIHELQKIKGRKTNLKGAFKAPQASATSPQMSVSKGKYKYARHACPQLVSRTPLKSQKGASHLKDIFALRWKRDKSLEGTIEKVLAILVQSLAFICGRSV